MRAMVANSELFGNLLCSGVLVRFPKLHHPEAYRILHETHEANVVKLAKRRHFAVVDAPGRATTPDESDRIILDESRFIYKVHADKLELIGEASPRVEVKLPDNEAEEALPVTRVLRKLGFWSVYGTLESNLQYIARQRIPSESYARFPEIENKFMVVGEPMDTGFHKLYDWLLIQESWQLLLPFPTVCSALVVS